MKHINYVLLVIGLAFAPIYIFPSGQPQPTDAILLCYIVLFTVRGGINDLLATVIHNVYFRVLVVFVVYAILVSASWYLILGDGGIMRAPAFYTYNLLLALTIYVSLMRDGVIAWKYLLVGILAAVAVSWFLIVSGFDQSLARQSGGFNNPNQMGYFGLLSIGVLILVHRRIKFSIALLYVSVLACTVVVLMSFSLTATGSLLVALAGVAWYLKASWKGIMGALVLVGLGVTIGGSLAASPAGEYLSRQWEVRWGTVDRKTEDVSRARGYDRIVAYPQYTVLGAAEGASWRFGEHGGQEIHSTPATLLFSYGIVGLAILWMFVILIVKQPGFGLKLIALSPMLYSMTHQGLRFTMFWVMLLLLIATVRTVSLEQALRARGSRRRRVESLAQ